MTVVLLKAFGASDAFEGQMSGIDVSNVASCFNSSEANLDEENTQHDRRTQFANINIHGYT